MFNERKDLLLPQVIVPEITRMPVNMQIDLMVGTVALLLALNDANHIANNKRFMTRRDLISRGLYWTLESATAGILFGDAVKYTKSSSAS